MWDSLTQEFNNETLSALNKKQIRTKYSTIRSSERKTHLVGYENIVKHQKSMSKYNKECGQTGGGPRPELPPQQSGDQWPPVGHIYNPDLDPIPDDTGNALTVGSPKFSVPVDANVLVGNGFVSGAGGDVDGQTTELVIVDGTFPISGMRLGIQKNLSSIILHLG